MKRVVQRLAGHGRAAARNSGPHTAESGARRVWRVSAEHPEGAWVDADDAAGDSGAPDSRAPRSEPDSWITSSMDLSDGAQIIEDVEDTIPAALLDELFPPPDAKKPKP